MNLTYVAKGYSLDPNRSIPAGNTSVLLGYTNTTGVGSSTTFLDTFYLINLDSGKIVDQDSYGYSLMFPQETAGFGSATPVTSVYAAGQDMVFYSYGSNLAASTV